MIIDTINSGGDLYIAANNGKPTLSRYLGTIYMSLFINPKQADKQRLSPIDFGEVIETLSEQDVDYVLLSDIEKNTCIYLKLCSGMEYKNP